MFEWKWTSSRYFVCQFSGKKDIFYFFWPKFSQKLVLESEFQKQCLQISESDSEPPRYHVCQFLVKTDNFEFFGLNLHKLPNYMQYIIVLITLRVFQRAGWRCVEVGTRFRNTCSYFSLYFSFYSFFSLSS